MTRRRSALLAATFAALVPMLPASLGHVVAAAGQAAVEVTAADGSDHQQPSLAADPRHPDHLALAYQDLVMSAPPAGSQQRRCGLALSTDTGHTWDSGILVGAGGRMPVPEGFAACWNPSVVFAPDGTLYYLFQTSRLPSDPYSHVLLAVSHDGGASFDASRAVDPSSPAYPAGQRAGGDWWPAMAVDARSGRLYVTWSRFTPDLDSSKILMAASADRGGSFAAPVQVSPADEWDVTGSVASVGAGGDVDIVWFDYTQWERGNVDAQCGPAGCCSCGSTLEERVQAIHDLYAEEGTRYDFVQGVGCEGFTASVDIHRTVPGPFPERGGECDLPGLVRAAVSRDGGASFGAATIPGTPVYLGCFVGDYDFGNPNAGQYGQPPPPFPTHVCDRTHYSNFDHNLVQGTAGIAAGQLLAAWWNDNTADAGGVARLYVAVSNDGAQHWRMRTPVGVRADGAVDEQHHPAIGTAPDGRVDVIYYDLSPRGQQNVYWVSAPRPGAGFLTPVMLNASPISAGVGPTTEDFRASFGDHLAVVSTKSAVLAAWTDTRSGHQEIAFRRVPAPSAGSAAPVGSVLPLALVIGVSAAAVVVGSSAVLLTGWAKRRRAARKQTAVRA